MRAVLDDDEESPEEEVLLDGIADKHHQLKRAVTVVQFLLRFNKEYRSLPSSEQRMNALKKFIRGDYQRLRKQLALRANKISQGTKNPGRQEGQNVLRNGPVRLYSYLARSTPNLKLCAPGPEGLAQRKPLYQFK